jgi:hypothetical protein
MTTHSFHSGSFRLSEGATLLGSTDDGVHLIDRWTERRALRPDQPR